jgi:hypothetical protein
MYELLRFDQWQLDNLVKGVHRKQETINFSINRMAPIAALVHKESRMRSKSLRSVLLLSLLIAPSITLCIDLLPHSGTLHYKIQKQLLRADPNFGKKHGNAASSTTDPLWENLAFTGTLTISWDQTSLYQKFLIPGVSRDFEFFYVGGITYSKTASLPVGDRRPGFVPDFIVPHMLPYNFPAISIFPAAKTFEIGMVVHALPNGEPVLERVKVEKDQLGRTISLQVLDYGNQPIYTNAYAYSDSHVLTSRYVPTRIIITRWKRPDQSRSAVAVKSAEPTITYSAELIGVDHNTIVPGRPESLFAVGDTLGYYEADGTGVGVDFRPGMTIDELAEAAFKIQGAAEETDREKSPVVYGPSDQRIPPAVAGFGLVFVTILSIGFLLKSRTWT